jgi:hypothetical protein
MDIIHFTHGAADPLTGFSAQRALQKDGDAQRHQTQCDSHVRDSTSTIGMTPRLWCRRSAELLGEPDEKPFRPANVAEPIRVFITHYVAYELRAALAELLERLVDVVHGEHDA